MHRDLLNQMKEEIPQVRPRVIAGASGEFLDEYLSFRHVVRSIYAFEFDPERVEALVKKLRAGFERVRFELLGFADFLDQLAQMDSD